MKEIKEDEEGRETKDKIEVVLGVSKLILCGDQCHSKLLKK